MIAVISTPVLAAAPQAPSIAWADYSKLGFVTINTDAVVSYKDMYTRVDVVEVPVSWNVWSGDKATKWEVEVNGEIMMSGSGTGKSTVLSFTEGGLKDMVVRLCNADGCSESATTELLISDTDGSHLKADLPMTTDPANTPYAQQKDNIVGTYFVEWGVYGRKYNVNDIPVNNLTHIIYGFIPICGGTGDNKSLLDPNPSGHQLLKKMCAGLPDYSVVVHDTWAALNSSYGQPATRLDGKKVGSLEIGKGTYGGLMALKKANPHIKILPSIGGWTLSDPFFGFTEKANRDVFVASTKEFLKTWKFYDGIDIDWEFPGGDGANASLGDSDKDGPAYIALMQELRAMLDGLEAEYGRKYELTSAIGAGYDKIEDVDYGAASQYMDNIFMMSYDFYGAWGPNTGHQTGIYCGAHISTDKCNGTGEFAGKPEYTLDNATKLLLAQGVPAKKLVVGAAMYARGWQDVVAENGNPIGAIGSHIDSSEGSPFNGSLGGDGTDVNEAAWAWEAGIMDYRGVLKFLESNPNAIVGWDEIAKASFVWDEVSRTLLTYDTPRSVLAKGEYLKSLGLGGIFSWEIDGDGNGDILNAMNQAVNNPQGQTDWSGSIITNEAPSISIAFPSGSVVHTEGDTAQFSALITDDKSIATVDVTVNGVTKAVIQDATTYSGSFVVTLGSNTVIFKATDNEGVLSQKTITIIGNAKDLVCEDGSSVVNGECAVDPIVCEEGSSLVDGKCVADEVVTETPFVAGSTKASNGKVYSYQGLCYQAKNSPGAWEVPTATSWFWTPVTCSGSIITNEAPSISIASPSGSVVHTEGDTAQFSALITDDKLIATVDVTVNGVTKAVIQDATTYSGSFVVTLGSNTVIFKATDNEGVLSQKTITIIGNAKGLVCEDGSSVVNGECVVDEVVSETPFVAGSTKVSNGEVYSYQGLCYQAKNSPGIWEVPTAISWFWTAVTCSGS
ncbi:glycosyl hydrolase family 18 protein [Moritella viscosa]|uniref:glycosyl hydrolase family 18 protein n=1 Tax=Moritella viscosa TaxID=80854 RepID=UPI00091BB762|nr:glycosyl hydrolase family 18 protein [Moritella viscosa]SGZ01457.1 Exochitinase [Moritella viscosa]